MTGTPTTAKIVLACIAITTVAALVPSAEARGIRDTDLCDRPDVLDFKGCIPQCPVGIELGRFDRFFEPCEQECPDPTLTRHVPDQCRPECPADAGSRLEVDRCAPECPGPIDTVSTGDYLKRCRPECPGFVDDFVERAWFDPCKPKCPHDLDLEAIANADGSVSLDWDDVSGADGYRVYRSSGGALVLLASATESELRDTSTMAGVTYTYAVSIVDHGVESRLCDRVEVTAIPYFGTFGAIAGALGAIAAITVLRKKE